MYVCVCNGVTEREIRQVATTGCRTMAELTMRTGCGAGCGCCIEMATALLAEVAMPAPAAHAADVSCAA
ncbi:MAG: bacterioferritin [Lysobacteraceae bacterium]|nr:MAG: bacterioferritin [Xanthomonadaceae bacterium]